MQASTHVDGRGDSVSPQKRWIPLTLILPSVILVSYCVALSFGASQSVARSVGAYIQLVADDPSGRLLFLASTALALILTTLAIHVFWLYGVIAMYRRKPFGLPIAIAAYWTILGTMGYVTLHAYRTGAVPIADSWAPLIILIVVASLLPMLHARSTREYCGLAGQSAARIGLHGLLLSIILTASYVAPVYGAILVAHAMKAEVAKTALNE